MSLCLCCCWGMAGCFEAGLCVCVCLLALTVCCSSPTALQITVIDGYQVQQLSRGFLDNFFESAGRQFSELFDEPGYYAEEDSGKSYEERLAEWRESVRQYEAQYGPVPQEVQQQASAALQAQRGPDPGEMQRRGAAGGSYYEREQVRGSRACHGHRRVSEDEGRARWPSCCKVRVLTAEA